jgi:hypothetical protein
MEIAPYPKDPRYGVTRDGRVFRIVQARFGRPVPYQLSPVEGENGYLYVGNGNGSGHGLKMCTVHRMVAETYIPNPLGLPEVAHENGVRNDDREVNLRWDTRVGNFADRVRHGTAWLGSKHKQAKLVEDQVLAIRQSKATGAAIAAQYGISLSHARRLKRGEGWSHV